MRAGEHEVAGHLAEFGGSLVVVSGDDSNLPVEVFAAQAEAAGAPYLQLHGSHFFPQEDTARTVALIREHLSG